MTEVTAKKHLRTMLRSFTGGTVLHLLAELYRDMAEEARQAGDEAVSRQWAEVGTALYVTGLGVDAACPNG